MFLISSRSRSKTPRQNQAGFGLIELLVSISIIVIVVSTILVRQNSFNGSVLLRSQAYEIALQLREVQLNAVSASYDTGNFRSVLGAHFDDAAGSNDSYRIFRDADNDNFYDVTEEFGLQGQIDNRFEIRDVRAVGAVGPAAGGLSIVFERPNFDARFFDANGQVNASSVEIDVARIGSTGTGPRELRTVEVTASGQISVQ
jgi:prepilin-type N-terminal cleavage/methylation domain-containing protein